MATNPRFEISSSSPDGTAFGYSNSHRSHFPGSSGGPNLERSSSFRDNHDSGNRAVTPGGAGPSFPSPSSAGGHGELLPLSQVLSLEPISSGEQKYARQLELRRATVAAMSMSGETLGNAQQKPLEQHGLEELKRIRSSLHENATRAREKSRTLAEAIAKLEKYRSFLQLRKRTRNEASGQERPISSASAERLTSASASSASQNKSTYCASPSHASIAEGSIPKPDEKGKSAVPNKRMRTSMQDVRLESRTGTPTFQRSSGLADRDRDSLKSGGNPGALNDEKDRLASGAGEGWEKTKTKGRRSAAKSDCIIATPAAAATEMERDHKWGAQHRNNIENRPRPTEGPGFRSGPVHGVVSMHKSGIRNEPDNVLPVGDKGDRFLFPDKDRSMLKSGAKLLHKEEGSLLSPTTVAKAKAARGPRTGTAISISPAGHTPRPHSADVWDRPTASASTASAPSRVQIPIAPSNRKRPAPTRSSSPPVAQWVGQRSQKMSRIARRMNVQSPVGPSGLGRDDSIVTADAETMRELVGTPTGMRSNPSTSPAPGLVKKITSTTALSQIKSKTERVTSPAGLSDSDDSDGGDVKSKEKWKKHGDTEGRFAAINQKMAPLFSPGKKSRVGPKEEGGDGIRRQGRSGRAVIQVRESSSVPHIEKGDGAANAKQLRSARPGLDKLEKPVDVKPGRPPTKKNGVDRKAITRPRRPVTIGASEVSGESDDDREELMAALHAAVNASAGACSSVFWKEMEPFFAYLTQDARESLRLQVKARELEEELPPGLPTSDIKMEKQPESIPAGQRLKISNGSMESNGGSMSMMFRSFREEQVSDAAVLNEGWPIVKQLPLSQRLLAALIIEEDLDDDSREDGSQLDVQAYTADGSSHDPSDSEQAGVEKEHDSESEVETRRGDNGKFNGWRRKSPYDSSYTSNGHRQWDSESELLNSPAKSEVRREEERHSSDINGTNKPDGRYQSLPLDDRIALELQSVGLYPDTTELAVREDDQIAEELKKSHFDLKEVVHKNKERLSLLERVVSDLRETEERDREKLAMRKLLENAFTKRLGCRGGLLGVSGSKSAALKAGRAAALSVAKRSVARWKHFVETGESCFTDSDLREILFCLSSKDSEAKASINTVGLSLMGSLELNLAASASTRWICHSSGMHRAEKDSCDSDRATAGTPSERSAERDDVWCTRSKEREVLLEDVVGSVPCGTKGKRSERDVCTSKVAGRQGLGGTIKGERKNKTKPRQKTGPLLKAVNGLLGKPAESSEKPPVRVKQEVGLGGIDAQPDKEAPLDLTHLQIPGMDDLVVSGDLGGQGQDLGSWLDFDDPGLPDAGGDFMGLDVPMDDLADLAMMM